MKEEREHINITMRSSILAALDSYCERNGSKRSTMIDKIVEDFLKEKETVRGN